MSSFTFSPSGRKSDPNRRPMLVVETSSLVELDPKAQYAVFVSVLEEMALAYSQENKHRQAAANQLLCILLDDERRANAASVAQSARIVMSQAAAATLPKKKKVKTR